MSVHRVKSVAHSTLSICLRKAHICSDLFIRLHLPLHNISHSEKICLCETGADTMLFANGAQQRRCRLLLPVRQHWSRQCRLLDFCKV